MKHNNSRFYLIWVPVCLVVALIAAILITYIGSGSVYDCANNTCVGGGTTYTRGFIPVGKVCTTCAPQYQTGPNDEILRGTVIIVAMYFVLFSILSLGALFIIRHFTKPKK